MYASPSGPWSFLRDVPLFERGVAVVLYRAKRRRVLVVDGSDEEERKVRVRNKKGKSWTTRLTATRYDSNF